MMKCETGEMRDGDGHKNVSIPVQDVGGEVLVLLDSLAPPGVVSSAGYF